MRIISLAIYNVLFQNSLYDILLHGLKDSILPGLMHAIAKMRQDHKAYFESCLIVRKMMVYVPPASEVHSMVNAAMAVQYLLIDDIVELSGGSLQFVSKINPGDLKKRAQSVADEALRKLDYPVLFGNSDPLVWITAAADKEAARFDHHDGAPVQKAISHAKPMDSDVAFSIDEDF